MSGKKVLYSTIILFIAGFITRIMGFFNRVYITKLIGAEGMGLIQLVHPIYALSFSFCVSGLTTVICRLVAEEKVKGKSGDIGVILKESLILSECTSIFFSIILFFFAEKISLFVMQDTRLTLSFRILAFAIPFMSASSCCRSYFLGLQESQYSACAQVIEQIARIGIVLFLTPLCLPYGLEYACAASVVGIVSGEAIACFYIFFSYLSYKHRKKLIQKPYLTHAKARVRILSMTIPLTATRITSTAFSAAETSIIPQALTAYGLSNSSALQEYGNLTGMVLPLILLPSALLGAVSTSLVPEISEASGLHQKQRVHETISLSVLFTVIIGTFAGGFFFFCGEDLCMFLFDMESLCQPLQIMAIICPFMYLQTTLSGLLNGLGEHTALFFIHIFSSLINILAILYGIPQIGLNAYFISTFVSALLSVVVQLYLLNRKTAYHPDIATLLSLPLIAILCGFGKYFFHSFDSSSFLHVLVSFFIYGIFYFLLVFFLLLQNQFFRLWMDKKRSAYRRNHL